MSPSASKKVEGDAQLFLSRRGQVFCKIILGTGYR
jgi:hypothetical protein